MYHAAFVLPAVFACYKTDGNLKKDNAYLHRLIDANIEGYRAIRNAGHKILPDADKEFEGAAWTRKRIPIFSLDLSVCGRNIRGRAMPGTASTPTWWICRPKASAGPSDPIQKQPLDTTKRTSIQKNRCPFYKYITAQPCCAVAQQRLPDFERLVSLCAFFINQRRRIHEQRNHAGKHTIC